MLRITLGIQVLLSHQYMRELLFHLHCRFLWYFAFSLISVNIAKNGKNFSINTPLFYSVLSHKAFMLLIIKGIPDQLRIELKLVKLI